MIGDVEKMIAVGLVWGATNALMRRGALLWDQALKSATTRSTNRSGNKLLNSITSWLWLLSIWQYSFPFIINLSASATFFAILSQAPISLAVPVTNATTFAATAVFGVILGEDTRIGLALFEFQGTNLTRALKLPNRKVLLDRVQEPESNEALFTNKYAIIKCHYKSHGGFKTGLR